MFRENIVVAVLDAQPSAEPDGGLAAAASQDHLIALISGSAASAVDIVVVASSSDELLDTARDYAAVDRKVHEIIESPVAVIKAVLDDEETLLDDESWMVYLHHSAPSDTAARLLAKAEDMPEGHETIALVTSSGRVLGQLVRVGDYLLSGALPVPGTSLL